MTVSEGRPIARRFIIKRHPLALATRSPLLLRGDCLVELARIPDGSVDAEMTPEYWPLIAARIERVTR